MNRSNRKSLKVRKNTMRRNTHRRNTMKRKNTRRKVANHKKTRRKIGKRMKGGAQQKPKPLEIPSTHSEEGVDPMDPEIEAGAALEAAEAVKKGRKEWRKEGMGVYRSVEVKTAARDKTLWENMGAAADQKVKLTEGLGTAHSGSGVTGEFIDLFRNKIKNWVQWKWLNEGTIWTGPMQLMKGKIGVGGTRVDKNNYYVHPPPEWITDKGWDVIDEAAIADSNGILYTKSQLKIGTDNYLR
jgi:hypothetical protein